MFAGQQYVAGIGLTTCLPDLDYETFSEGGYVWIEAEQKWESPLGKGNKKNGLTLVGTYNYVLHPSFDVIQLAYNLKNGEGARIWRPGWTNPEDLLAWARSYRADQPPESVQGLMESWHNFFEVCVWNLHCVPKYGWPPLYLDQMRDAMAKAALEGYPQKMDNAAQVLRLVNQKDPEGGGLIKKLTVPKKPTKKDPSTRWTRETAAADFAKFDAYNVQDIMVEGEASLRIADLPPRELEIWKVDQRINHRGMQIDLVSVENCIAIVEQAMVRYNAELYRITNYHVSSYTKVADTLRWMKTQGVYLDGLDEDVVEEELTKPHSWVVLRVLKIRQTLSFGSVKKLYGMRYQTCTDGRLRAQFRYAANHTHHWAGQDVQVMNLFKSDKFNKPEQIEFALGVIASRNLEFVEEVFKNGPPWDAKDNTPMDALDVIANCLRSMIVARPGTRLITADYNAIQAVITAAMAGEKWQLDVFHTHGKIYEMTASMLTGKPLEYYLQYRKDNEKHHPDRQLYGKIPTLANGFGAYIGGWRRFDDDGVLGSDAEVKELIFKTWAKNPNICELWGGQTRNKFGKDRQGNPANEFQQLYGLEGAAVAATMDRECRAFPYRGVTYQRHGDNLYCWVPGGGAPMVYHDIRVEPSKRPYARPWELELKYMGWNTNSNKKGAKKGGWSLMDLYGGVLTQNAVAKTHREFQADTLVALERSGVYLPVHHAHDENVTEVTDGIGTKEEYLTIVNRGKSWAVDDWGRPWPVKAPSADETYRYGRWE